MEKKNRYILNMGLAFDEDRAMKKLSQRAKEGWLLEEMTLLRYKLVRGQPKEIVYSMDYKELVENEKEYFELFQSTGWEHMCSYGPYHFFAAPPKTVPIYTEKESYLSKYKRSKDGYKKAAIISMTMLIVVNRIRSLLSSTIEGTTIRNILFLIEIVLVAIASPSIMVCIALYVKQRKTLRKLVK